MRMRNGRSRRRLEFLILTVIKNQKLAGKIYKMKTKEVRKRKKLTAEKKYQILKEVASNPDKKAEIIRREGLYSGDLKRFEEAAREGALKSLKALRPGPKRVMEVPIKEHEALQKDLLRKEKALAELSVEFTILKKKVDGD